MNESRLSEISSIFQLKVMLVIPMIVMFLPKKKRRRKTVEDRRAFCVCPSPHILSLGHPKKCNCKLDVMVMPVTLTLRG